MTFNNDLPLWDTPACRKMYPRLTVHENGDVADIDGSLLARFATGAEARTTLRLAGWHFSGPHGWTSAEATLASADMPAA